MILGFDPRYQFVHEDDVVARAGARGPARAAGRVQRGRRRRARPERGGGPAQQALRPDPAALGDRPGHRGAAPPRAEDPAGDAQPAALRPRAGQPPAEGRRLSLRPHQPRDRAQAGRAPAPAPAAALGAQEPYRYEREVEEFLRWSPHVRGSQTRKPPTLTAEQVVELQRLLERARHEASRPGARARAPAARGPQPPRQPRAEPRRGPAAGAAGGALRRPRGRGGHLAAGLPRGARI